MLQWLSRFYRIYRKHLYLGKLCYYSLRWVSWSSHKFSSCEGVMGSVMRVWSVSLDLIGWLEVHNGRSCFCTTAKWIYWLRWTKWLFTNNYMPLTQSNKWCCPWQQDFQNWPSWLLLSSPLSANVTSGSINWIAHWVKSLLRWLRNSVREVQTTTTNEGSCKLFPFFSPTRALFSNWEIRTSPSTRIVVAALEVIAVFKTTF